MIIFSKKVPIGVLIIIFSAFLLSLIFDAKLLIKNGSIYTANIAEIEQNFNINNIQFVKIAGQNLKVNLALIEAEQEKGLSGRANLAENEGMLFVFEKSGVHSFWMKDMNFPIDIIWLNENLKVIFIKKNAEPDSFPETFGSKKSAKYVLEVSAGFSEKNNLEIGDQAKFYP